jgi:hypothetical protein
MHPICTPLIRELGLLKFLMMAGAPWSQVGDVSSPATPMEDLIRKSLLVFIGYGYLIYYFSKEKRINQKKNPFL